MKLVIVESPTKAKSIQKYLGNDYVVKSSKGHIRDLAISGIGGYGIDLETFTGDYVVMKDKKKVVADLRKSVKIADIVYIASDPDREGEAIAQDLIEALKIPKKKAKRIVFHEVTKKKVIEAIGESIEVDYDMVDAQRTRRMLDRVVGFDLSKVVKKAENGKSAGRVQSAVLRILSEREAKITAFIPDKFYVAKIEITIDGVKHVVESEEKFETRELATDALGMIAGDLPVISVKKSKKQKYSQPVFTTSTLQQTGNTRLGFPTDYTMRLAQKLFEGIEDTSGELSGRITYMRTDSTRINEEAEQSIEDLITSTLGAEYIAPLATGKGSKGAQDAHEGVRPTDINIPVSKLIIHDTALRNLYDLIYRRTLAAKLIPAAYTSQIITLGIAKTITFKINNKRLDEEGYLKVYAKYESNEWTDLMDVKKNDELKITGFGIVDKESKPPKRFTESSIIKEMEKRGIGRPSTYATMLTTLKKREYIEVVSKAIKVNDYGLRVDAVLDKHFNKEVSAEYTANMEAKLDYIASG